MEWKGPGFSKDEIKEPLHMCSKKSIEIYRNPHFAATLLIGFDAHISSRNRHKSTFRDWQVNFASVCSLKSWENQLNQEPKPAEILGFEKYTSFSDKTPGIFTHSESTG